MRWCGKEREECGKGAGRGLAMAPGPREAPPAPTRPLVVMYVVFVVLAIAQLARGSAVATVITISQVTTSPLISPTSLALAAPYPLHGTRSCYSTCLCTLLVA